MKKIMTAAAALLITAASFAQGSDSPPPANGAPAMHQRVQMTPEQRAKRETDQINQLAPMSTDVYQKVLDANTQAAKDKAAIMGGTKKNELTDDQRAQLKKISETQRQQVKTAMGKDLYEKYQAARRESRGGAPGQGQGPMGGEQK